MRRGGRLCPPACSALAKTRVIANQCAGRCGDTYFPCMAPFCHASVGGGDCPPSCQPIPAHCRGRQSGHFLETGSLLPPPAALRRFPRRPARHAPHPPKPCHCEERSDVAIRFSPASHSPPPPPEVFFTRNITPPAAGTEKYCLFLVKKLTGLFVS